ncbi:MAG: Gfo/Idh/MocA family oxidoreductase [Ruminococcaceae bacterium]|nr:Gfo/Idh/MocA family oxidoreductase [Oscillospiraceae bacterium]
MNKRKVNFALVGLSEMGMRHALSIKNSMKMELVAVCDKLEDRVSEAVNTLDVKTGTTDWRELLSNDDIEAVVLCIPDQVHVEMTVAFLEAGKDVLCEKPMALSVEECEEMRAAEKRTGKRLMIGQICRYTPSFIKTRELIEQGEIGELYYVESEYAHDYSLASEGVDRWRLDPKREPFIGGGCHAMDLLRWIAGNPYEVCAFANHKCLTDWPVNDCIISIFKFPNNVIGKVFVSIGCKRNGTMRSVFYGTKGTIICDNNSNYLSVFKEPLAGKDSIFPDKHISQTTPINLAIPINHHNTTHELESFADCIINDTPVPTTSYDGECTVVACVAATQASKIGQTLEIAYPEE